MDDIDIAITHDNLSSFHKWLDKYSHGKSNIQKKVFQLFAICQGLNKDYVHFNIRKVNFPPIKSTVRNQV